MESFGSALALVLPSTPLLLVYLVGAVFALAKLHAWPRPATFALVGFLGNFIAQAMRTASNLMVLPQYRGTLEVREIATRIAAINLLAVLLTAAAMIMLLIAIFTDRETRQ